MNPIVVAQEIKATDEKSVIQKLWQNKKNWTRFVNSIADGDQAWVDVGLLLLPHAAGLASRDLRLAFEDALIKSPITIVTAIGSHSPNLDIVCGPSAHPDYDLAEDSITQRLSAVGSVIAEQRERDRPIRERLNRCADSLQSADEALRGRHSH